MLISCLQPATAIPERYWTVQRKQPSTKPRDSVERFRELFKQSVRLHLRSDVPLGVSLSGGIDSSAIVAMAHFLNGNSGNLHSISYIADDPRVSEQSWCDIVAQAASLHQHRVEISASELKQDFAELVRIQEQPFGSPTIYAQYRIFRAARECGLKVMLGGHGADQYIGSYHPHLAVRFGSLMRRGRLLQAARFLRRASSSPGATGFFTLRSGMRQALPEALVRQVGRWQSNETLPVSEEWFRNHGVSVGFAARAHRFNSLHDVLALTMLETNLPGLLRFEDRNAMAFSIENRVPFLTTALVEFVFSLPEEDLVAEDGTCKSVLMRAMKGLVPEQVLARRDKLGFCMPMQELGTQLAPWMKELLQHATLIPALDAGRLLKDAERTLDSSASRFIQPAIWKWISLISWAREFNVVFE